MAHPPSSHAREARSRNKGFFASLFDLNFTSFVTLSFLKVIYVLLIVVAAVFGLVILVQGLSQGGSAAALALVLAPLVTLLMIIMFRIYLEFLAVLFRIGENTSSMAATLSSWQAGGQAVESNPGYGAATSAVDPTQQYGQAPQYGQGGAPNPYGTDPYGQQGPR